MRGNRYEVVHEQHLKHGKFVRIAPNHVSIADHQALNQVYGHSTATLKSDFYDAFAAPGFPRGLFNTRSRPEHTRKRKIVSHTFAPKSIIAFEPFIRREIQVLIARFEEFANKAKAEGRKAYKLDMLMWMNYFAFDTIGSLAFGSVFGMMEQGRDDAEVEFEKPDGSVVKETCNAVQIINERGEYAGTMGCVPVWMRPIAAQLPWFSLRLKSVKKLSGIALSRVNYRLNHGSDREDLLAKLQSGKDERGEPMGKQELTMEGEITRRGSKPYICETSADTDNLFLHPALPFPTALTQLIAGSDTTSNTATAVIYHVCTHPEVKKKLYAELDQALAHAEEVPLAADVQDLPYLNAVLSESLRYHSTSALGLPRIVPKGGATIVGKYFPAGTVVSVPSYTIHRNPAVWGADAEAYNPERWLAPGARAAFEKSFVPFSTGPRACVGRNVAMMELQLVIATLFRKFDFELVDPQAPLETVEGFLRKPTTLPTYVALRR